MAGIIKQKLPNDPRKRLRAAMDAAMAQRRSALAKGDTTLARQLLSDYIDCEKQLGLLEHRSADAEPGPAAASIQSPWCNQVAKLLGFTPSSLTAELHRDLKMWLRRDRDLPLLTQFWIASGIAATARENKRPALNEQLYERLEEFLAFITPQLEPFKPLLKELIDATLLEEEPINYSGVRIFD